MPPYKVNRGQPPPYRDLAVPLGDAEACRYSACKANAGSVDKTGVPPSRSYQQIQDVCTNCSCPLVLEILQKEKEIHLPTIPRACLFPLQYRKDKSLCRERLSMNTILEELTAQCDPGSPASSQQPSPLRPEKLRDVMPVF